MGDNFNHSLKGLRAVGFLPEGEPLALRDRFSQRWDDWESHEGVPAELMLAALDERRVWQRDLKIQGPPFEAYREALLEWAEISWGVFRPQKISGPDPIEFEVDGYLYRYQPRSGHYLDMGLLKVVNSSLYGQPRFEVSDGLGMPNWLSLLSPGSRSALEGRGWHFVTEADTGMHGFVSTFYEQGMEEPAWSIFQDRTFCESHDRGWDRAGLQRFSEGAHLTVFEHDGRVLWSGVMEGRRRGWFGRLHASDGDWHPAEVAPEVWQSYLVRTPPLRAHYRV
jgi:hypothetical protein